MSIRAGHIVVTSDFDVFGITAYKTGDESVTSSTTLQNDDLLVLPVVANARYIIDACLFYTGATANAGGLKISWAVPSGATMLWYNRANNYGAAPAETQYNISAETAGAAGRGIGSIGASNVAGLSPIGTLVTSSTSGNLQLQWAQNASNATATTMKTGSFIRLSRFA